MRRKLILWLVWLPVLGGCADPKPEYTEVKRIDERLTPLEMKTFFAIVDELPDQTLPPFPEVYSPPPNWASDRALVVKELLANEEVIIARRWEIATIRALWESDGKLRSALRRHQLTLDQFIGLSLCIGVAMNRTTLREDQRPQEIVDRGYRSLARLRDDSRPFSSLNAPQQFDVLRQAAWLTRSNRAEKLASVPEENITLVTTHAEKLKTILPVMFRRNPLDEVADRYTEEGVPFETLPDSPRDDVLTWSRKDAMIGVPADN